MEIKRKRVLIIEDTKELSKLVTNALNAADFDVEVAENGMQGLEKLKNERFNLILLDLVMPEKSGFEVLNAFQTMGKKTPIIIYTNMAAELSREEALKLGAADYIEKVSISLDDLVERIGKIASSN